jgi:hypothetical protein
LQVNQVGEKQMMIPFQVDPSWYEKYWWREPAPRRLSAFALLRRGLERFKKIQGSNVMTHAIRFHKPGGPEVLVWEKVPVGKPGPGEAHIRHTAVGLNFVDIYNRSGLYPVQLPSGVGGEAAGVVEEVGGWRARSEAR